MGIFSSSKSTSIATAKLILDNGKLEEFSYPVKVNYVISEICPASFICDSDEMDFDGVVSAVGDGEELRPGQIYFALPLSRANRRLAVEEMAALAVKASSALGNVEVFSGECGVGKAARGGGAAESGRRRRGQGGGAWRGKFTARLSGIPE